MASAGQDEMLATFQQVTGWNDVEVCNLCLNAHGWDLDAAVGAALSFPGEEQAALSYRMSQNSGGGAADRAGPRNVQQEEPEDAFHEHPPRRGWFHNMTGVPLLRIVSFGLLGGGPPGYNRVGSEAQRFADSFALDYNVHPTPQTVKFSEALANARRQFKFLVVYLHSPHHQDTPQFLNDTLCTPVMKDFIDENFLFWMGSILNPEAYSVSVRVRACGFPYIAVMTTATEDGSPYPTVCDANEGVASKEAMMQWFTQILENQGPELVAQRADQEQRNMDRRIREEQEQAFQEGLLEDQRREQEREAQEKREREEREREERERREREEREEAERQRAEAEEKAKQQRKADKAALFDAPEPTGAGTALIAFRLPHGSRVQRRFLASDTVQSLYDYLDAFGDIEFAHYEVATNLPKVVYNDRSVTLEAAGLSPQAMLFVQEVL